jgi:hypothetical protein
MRNLVLSLAPSLALGCGSELTGYWLAEPSSDDETATVNDTHSASETPQPDLPTLVELDVPVSPTAQWSLRSLGDVGSLADVAVLGPSEAYAVGGRRVLRFDGLNWATYGEPGEVDLYGVAGDAGGGVVVVGQGGSIFRKPAGALDWEPMISPADRDLHAIVARSSTDMVAVGDERTVLVYDGQAWTSAHVEPGVDLRALWLDPTGTGLEGFFAVGTAGKGLAYQDGAFSTDHISFQSTTLFDVARADAVTYTVGTGGTIAVKKATGGWKAQATNDPDQRDLYAIVATADERVAFGADGVVLRLAAESWSVESLAATRAATGHLAAARERLGAWMVLAASGGGLTRDGDTWIDMHTRPDALIHEVVGTQSGALWAVGRDGLLFHRKASGGENGWTVVPTGTQAHLFGVAVDWAGAVWAVGDQGTILRRATDGTITHFDPPVPAQLFGIAAAAGEIVVSGQGGILLRGDPTSGSFQLTQTGATANLYAVEYGGDGALWIAGSFGTLLRAEPGKVPSFTMSGVGYDLTALSATAKGVVAVGHSGAILEATPQAVTLLNESPGLFLYGVASRPDGSGYAVGWNGVILAFGEGGVTQEVSGTNAILRAVWLSEGEALALGSNGVVLAREGLP